GRYGSTSFPHETLHHRCPSLYAAGNRIGIVDASDTGLATLQDFERRIGTGDFSYLSVGGDDDGQHCGWYERDTETPLHVPTPFWFGFEPGLLLHDFSGWC